MGRIESDEVLLGKVLLQSSSSSSSVRWPATLKDIVKDRDKESKTDCTCQHAMSSLYLTTASLGDEEGKEEREETTTHQPVSLSVFIPKNYGQWSNFWNRLEVTLEVTTHIGETLGPSRPTTKALTWLARVTIDISATCTFVRSYSNWLDMADTKMSRHSMTPSRGKNL